jgi:hypothetical protein
MQVEHCPYCNPKFRPARGQTTFFTIGIEDLKVRNERYIDLDEEELYKIVHPLSHTEIISQEWLIIRDEKDFNCLIEYLQSKEILHNLGSNRYKYLGKLSLLTISKLQSPHSWASLDTLEDMLSDVKKFTDGLTRAQQDFKSGILQDV